MLKCSFFPVYRLLNSPLLLVLYFAFTANLAPSSDFSPYIRLGAAYHLTGGDYVESASPGLLAGIGFEFKRNSPVGFGVEFTYDASEIEFESYDEYYYWWDDSESTKDMKPFKTMVCLFARF